MHSVDAARVTFYSSSPDFWSPYCHKYPSTPSTVVMLRGYLEALWSLNFARTKHSSVFLQPGFSFSGSDCTGLGRWFFHARDQRAPASTVQRLAGMVRCSTA